MYMRVYVPQHHKHACGREPMFLARPGKVTQPSGDVKAGILAACKAPNRFEDSGRRRAKGRPYDCSTSL